MTPLLEGNGVTKIFGGLVAVSDVTFDVPPKSIVSIIGPNGASKTTFFNMLTGLYRPSSGRSPSPGPTSQRCGPIGSSPPESRERSRTSACSAR